MNPSREEALFALAVEKLAEERAPFLAGECAADTALRQCGQEGTIPLD